MAKALKSVDVIQGWFIWAAATFYVAQFVQTVYSYSQIPNGQQTAEMYTSWFAGHAVVAFVWVLVWLSKRKREFTTPVLFDTTLVTFTLLLLMWALSTIPFLFPSLLQNFASPWLFNAFILIVPIIVTAPVAVGLILHLRRTKQW
jgi:hypothetical protein